MAGIYRLEAAPRLVRRGPARFRSGHPPNRPAPTRRAGAISLFYVVDLDEANARCLCLASDDDGVVPRRHRLESC